MGQMGSTQMAFTGKKKKKRKEREKEKEKTGERKNKKMIPNIRAEGGEDGAPDFSKAERE